MAAPALPAAALSSPLALYDQRLSLPAFEALSLAEPGEYPASNPGERIDLEPGPRADPVPSRKPAEPSRRSSAELRIVTGESPASSPAKPPPAPMQTPSKSARAVPAGTPALKPGPLDIEAEALETARRPGDAHPDPTEVAKPMPARVALHEPSIALPHDRLEEPEAATDPSVEPAAEDPPRRSAPLQFVEPQKTVPARSLVPVEPSPLASQPVVSAQPVEPVFDVHQDEREEAQREPAQMAIEPQGGPAVSIGEIVIEVREPLQAVPARAQQTSIAPSSAAAASLIGPLPVRRSAISLYGMRRR
jgi:hypothetical protein